MGLRTFASTALCPTISAPMTETVCPTGSGRRMPASCSSSNESSMPSVSTAVENGTDCLESMTLCSSLYGIISWWYIAMATYSAGSVSERKNAR